MLRWLRSKRRAVKRRLAKRRAAPPSAPKPKYVLSRRGDGLGERLNSLLNAMRLAEILDVDFRFTWPIGHVGKDPNHAIVPPEEFFSADFVAEHLMPTADAKKGGFEEPAGPADDLDSLRRQLAKAERGLKAPGRPLSTRIDPEAVPAVQRGFANEFDAVGFHPSVAAAIEAARAVPLGPGAVGIHLRAGDNLFGHYRAFTVYWRKVVPLPAARALIERFQAEGREVLVFGQDAVAIEDLCRSTGATDAATKRPTGMTSAESAMFDLVLLSRCDRIVSGWSGFAIQAASISDKGVDNYLDLISPSDLVATTRADIARHGDRYDPTHRAFAWWVAYYVARDDLSYDESMELVESALQADPSNPRSRLRLAALSYRHGQYERGDDNLAGALVADVAAGGPVLESVMLFSLLLDSGYDSREILDDIELGAEHGSGPALIYRAALRAQRGDATGAREDEAAFREQALRDPQLGDVAGLDEMVGATIDERIRRAGRPGLDRRKVST